jgi:hypothetical protein
MSYCADSGAEKSIISARKLKELQELGSLLQTTKLNRVVVFETVGRHRIIADRSVRMNILLHSATGPGRPVKSFEVLVIDEARTSSSWVKTYWTSLASVLIDSWNDLLGRVTRMMTRQLLQTTPGSVVCPTKT